MKIFVLVALSAALAVTSGCGPKQNEQAGATTIAASSRLSDKAVAPGIVEPLGGNIELAAQEAGRVAEVLIQEGQAVKKGTVLARLEDAQQRAALEASKAEVAEATAALDRAQRGATRQELIQLRQERDAAAARARLSTEEAQRNQRLKDKAAITQAELDRSLRQAEADSATAAALEARFRNLAAGTRPEDRAAARARVQAAKARLEQASAALERRVVTSPVDATVLWSRYKPGEYYNPGGQALFSLGDVSRLQVRADVDEIDVGRVQLGERAVVKTDEGGAAVAEGQVVWVSPRMGRKNLTTEAPTARSDTRIREVLVEVPAKEPLLPGLRVWIEVPESKATAAN